MLFFRTNYFSNYATSSWKKKAIPTGNIRYMKQEIYDTRNFFLRNDNSQTFAEYHLGYIFEFSKELSCSKLSCSKNYAFTNRGNNILRSRLYRVLHAIERW